MPDSKRRRLDSAAAAMQQKYGPRALHKGSELAHQPLIPHIPTGFPALDAITGCQGVPLAALSLFSGRTTSGKLTVAYKVLANAQRGAYGDTAYAVGLLDLNRTADPDYLVRCGVDLDALLVARPPVGPQAVEVLGDLLQTQRLRALLVDNLADLAAAPAALRRLDTLLNRAPQLLRGGCALIVLDDPHAPWLRWLNLDYSHRVRWCAALHIEMQRERWLKADGQLVGYQAQARLLKSRWVYSIRSAPVAIEFNGTVKAATTW
jgi:hypothetical protein